MIIIVVTFSRYRSRYLTARWRAVLENLLTSPCSLSAVSVRAISTCAVREMFRLHMSTAVSKDPYSQLSVTIFADKHPNFTSTYCV